MVAVEYSVITTRSYQVVNFTQSGINRSCSSQGISAVVVAVNHRCCNTSNRCTAVNRNTVRVNYKCSSFRSRSFSSCISISCRNAQSCNSGSRTTCISRFGNRCAMSCNVISHNVLFIVAQSSLDSFVSACNRIYFGISCDDFIISSTISRTLDSSLNRLSNSLFTDNCFTIQFVFKTSCISINRRFVLLNSLQEAESGHLFFANGFCFSHKA